MRIIMAEPSSDDVGYQRQQSKNGKGEESDDSSPQGWAIIDYEPKLLQHHDVDEGLAVGGVKVGDAVGLLLGVAFLDVDFNDLVFLILELVLDLPELSFLLAFDELFLRFGW